MIELITNCSHGSEIATYLETDETGGRKIIKSATTKEGITDIINELKGWNWYQQRKHPKGTRPFCSIVQNNDKYIKIEISYFIGNKNDYRRGLVYNAKLIESIINEYISIWPRSENGMVPIHGDMSIDNIIYNSEEIYIIDWEHFSEKGAPWGFDIVYLLFECLWFEMKRWKKPGHNAIEIIRKNLRILNNTHCLQRPLIDKPLRYLKEFINGNSEIWGSQLKNFPDKFPVLKFSQEQISSIDLLILGGCETL